MYHPKLDTEQGRRRQEENIEASRERLKGSIDFVWLALGGDNFEFVSFEELPELKLWERRDARSS